MMYEHAATYGFIRELSGRVNPPKVPKGTNWELVCAIREDPNKSLVVWYWRRAVKFNSRIKCR